MSCAAGSHRQHRGQRRPTPRRRLGSPPRSVPPFSWLPCPNSQTFSVGFDSWLFLLCCDQLQLCLFAYSSFSPSPSLPAWLSALWRPLRVGMLLLLTFLSCLSLVLCFLRHACSLLSSVTAQPGGATAVPLPLCPHHTGSE